MTRIFTAVILAATVTAGVHAWQPFSFGGGLAFDFETGAVHGGVTEQGVGASTVSMVRRPLGGGVWGFADSRFAEFSLGVNITYSPEIWNTAYDAFHAGISENRRQYGGMSVGVNFGLLGKLPQIGPVTPLAGLSYNLVVFHVVYHRSNPPPVLNPPPAFDLSSLRFQLGAGTDFALAGGSFIRLQLLAHYRLRTRDEANLSGFFADSGFATSTPGGFGAGLRLGWGFTPRR